jgi:hypothetical protein
VDEEEKTRKINWVIWFPIIVAILGATIWYFLFIILDFGA